MPTYQKYKYIYFSFRIKFGHGSKENTKSSSLIMNRLHADWRPVLRSRFILASRIRPIKNQPKIIEKITYKNIFLP